MREPHLRCVLTYEPLQRRKRSAGTADVLGSPQGRRPSCIQQNWRHSPRRAVAGVALTCVIRCRSCHRLQPELAIV
jgi:hypothetical protein